MCATFRPQQRAVNSHIMCCFFFFTLHRVVLLTHLMLFSPLLFITLWLFFTLIAFFRPRVNLFNLAVMTAEQEEETYDLKSASLDPQTGGKHGAMVDE